MSRRSLLAATGRAPVIPDPPDGGGGDPDPTGWPTTTDPVVLAMRPTGRLVASGTATDTATRDALASSLAAAVDADAQAGFLYWDGIGPDYRTELFVQPGTYAGGGNSSWRAIVGTDTNQRTVLASSVANGGVIHSFGSHYMENLHLTAQTNGSNTAPKYPWHITGGEMNIAANCTFDLSQIEPDTVTGGEGIAGWVGADGDAGMTIVFYGCHFEPGPLMNTLNLHGPATGDLRLPMTTIFVNCTGLNGVEIYCPGGVATAGGGSRLYVINTPVAGLGADTGCHVYTNSAAPAMTANAGTIHRDVTTWPIPDGGLSDLWSDYFYPSSIGDEPTTIAPTVTDAAPMAPVAGRTYLTRVRLPSALHVNVSGVTITTAAGQVRQFHFPADTPYAVDEAPSPAHPTTNPETVTMGQMPWTHYYAYTRYPGGNGIWHKVQFTNASARVTGSAQLAGLTDCYYTDDGTTLVPVAAGTPHPVPFIRAT